MDWQTQLQERGGGGGKGFSEENSLEPVSKDKRHSLVTIFI